MGVVVASFENFERNWVCCRLFFTLSPCPVSQRIWTPRGFGPPGPNPLADLDPPGPYPLADLDPLRGFGPPTNIPFFQFILTASF